MKAFTAIRIGLVGDGLWARRVHIPSINSVESVELVAICGPDPKRVEVLAKEQGARWTADNFKHLIANPEIDAILIAAPIDVHAPVSIESARAKKHILCEKPMALTLQDAKAMVEAVEETGVHHMVAFTWRNVPAVGLARRMIAAGEIGPVHHIAAHLLQGGWLKLDDKRPWRFDRRRMGSGIVGDLGVHVFDLLTWVVGYPILRVCARLSTFGPKPEILDQQPVFDDAHILLELGGGARGSVRLSRIATSASRSPFPNMHHGMEIYGERGALIYDLHNHSHVELRRLGGTAQLIPAPDPLPDSDDQWLLTRELGRRQIKQFAHGVQKLSKIEPDFYAGLYAQTVIDAAERSHTSDAWTEVEPA